MDFSESLKELKFDKRMIRWNLNQKIITQKEHEAHLKSLKDISRLQAPPINKEKERPARAPGPPDGKSLKGH